MQFSQYIEIFYPLPPFVLPCSLQIYCLSLYLTPPSGLQPTGTILLFFIPATTPLLLSSQQRLLPRDVASTKFVLTYTTSSASTQITGETLLRIEQQVMTDFNKILFLFILTSSILACTNSSISQPALHGDTLWSAKDSLAFYYPQSNNPDSGFLNTGNDNFSENWYSSALFSFREPILYNKNLEIDIYRFLWLRSFHRPVVFILTKTGDRITLNTKILNHQPEFSERGYDPRGWDDLDKFLKGKTIEKFGDSLVVVKADRKADIVYNETKEIPLTQWDNFEQTVQKAKFWTMPATREDEAGMDGAEWIVEGKVKNRYWFVVRWGPRSEFRKIGLFLIQLSGLKEEIY